MSSPSQTAAEGQPETVPKPSIKFIARDPRAKLDLRIQVFAQEFLVHSDVLKANSAFFRTFLDSPEKTPAPPSAPFRYEYVSVEDSDGTWGLEVAGKNSGQTKTSTEVKVKGAAKQRDSLVKFVKKRQEIIAFERLLCAIYHKPYILNVWSELERVVRLADFYCAVPAVSDSMDGVLFRSPMLIDMISDKCEEILKMAHKLHHPALFREALVHVVSGRPGCSSNFDDVPDLVRVITDAQVRLNLKRTQVLKETFWAARLDKSINEKVFAALREWNDPSLDWSASVCRNIQTTWPPTFFGGQDDRPSVALKELLANNLALTRYGSEGSVVIEAGVGTYKDKFLCTSIEDHELPWNSAAGDW
ncbi:hypothetical protein LSUE1_G008359 [Lachnellula suecica]|uniref:BTB domain-containing protein n=1 Tax=Lachnellula suecica TaxID=602035 RepID=A0A8T9BZU9_9HELO|nr:hypothetical protein LSUE1_G008359 [Lachnellula suecica]